MKTLNTSYQPVALALLAIFTAGAVGIAVFAPASHAASDAKPAAAKPALTVTTAKPVAARLPIKLAANGNVAAWQEASVSSQSTGLRLAEVRVNVGDVVKAGDVLAVFAAETVEADLAQAKAALQEAEANAAEAVANAARARSLQNTGALSAQQISQYSTAEQSANARIASAKAALASQQLRMKYTRVIAPDNGVITARSATVGAVSGTGTELFRMILQSRLEWRAEVVAADLRQLKPGTTATVKAANGSEASGKIRMIAPTVDAQTRSALVYVDLPASASAGKDAPFKAGMFASGQFDLGTSDAITVPQQAIVVRDGFSFVFRLNADQHVSQIRVQPGRRLGERIEVLSGLNADTQVVVRGAGFLNDGDLVQNVADSAAPAKLAAK
ncbi:efflux RND transporter periplasmic adaptor subunit [Duganella qianjiadongensis]|uniref:Efflux RND transporter periplasmic adaptor subunit n=1 Tax=Duganella qianjiadongensis TaxID=2692176 RepID=A0ABW9VJ00_9BURK|nr:efflux RND transporter periplasmic adaptor subunit [Duganella qianjiadongensis]MYM38620.1 efflux RND transporter periplasmic adaptor subunit [Duganella qianjiadongensis]